MRNLRLAFGDFGNVFGVKNVLNLIGDMEDGMQHSKRDFRRTFYYLRVPPRFAGPVICHRVLMSSMAAAGDLESSTESGYSLRRYDYDSVEEKGITPDSSNATSLENSTKISAEKSSTSNGAANCEIQFEGKEDREDPRNFGQLKKRTIMIIISLSSASVYAPRTLHLNSKLIISLQSACVSAIYTATYAQITKELGCSELAATAELSTFILGIGIAPLFLSPLSEVSSLPSHLLFI